MRRMPFICLMTIYCCIALFGQLAWAEHYDFHQHSFPRTVVLAESGDVLKLFGVGLHKKYFQDDYFGAFYAQRLLKTPEEVLADEGPKQMVITYLRAQNVPGEYWEAAINLNNSPDLVKLEQIRVSQFIRIVNQPMHLNDTVIIEYVPKVGTKIIIRGNIRGIIKGSEFYSLILKVWMGREPPSKKFRKDLFVLSDLT